MARDKTVHVNSSVNVKSNSGTTYSFSKSYLSNEYRKKHTTYSTSYWSIIFKIFFIIFVTVFVVSIFRKFGTSDSVTFSGILEWLSNVKSFKIQVNIGDYGVGGNWGLFDSFRVFLDGFGTIFGCILWLGANLINTIIFIGQFVAYLLV